MHVCVCVCVCVCACACACACVCTCMPVLLWAVLDLKTLQPTLVRYLTDKSIMCDGRPQMVFLSSCCDLEWLVDDNTRFQWSAGTVTCYHGPRGRNFTLEAIADFGVICPCLNDTVATATSQDGCTAQARTRVNETHCGPAGPNVSSPCPDGSRMANIIMREANSSWVDVY
jgi:hypothetical protein